ncbi:carbamoyl-phosphate synthase L chain, ATP binding domain-containing protein [Amylocarpus encephaloides]|uniref:Carbamoyl-phosphate synthase L chain, ATP binding domain-containing protein n=1 Tax=Amylocarpus encephaloides TaxID=45428 RepID=A0A9P7YIY4_9HELO|nr:carbamoyl-phosphate synthase L chain, ATP binding domain-containing protein [Amylocarpus encephaloides]
MAPEIRPIKRLLIANRGEITTRILQTTRELSLDTYTLTTSTDTLHTHSLPLSRIIPLPSPSSYTRIPTLLALVKEHNIDTIHPGYGFLSESALFASAMLSEANALVIGPGAEVLERTGDKLQARGLAEECGVAVLPALREPTSGIEDIQNFAEEIGFPILLKSSASGGGRGIRLVPSSSTLEKLLPLVLAESPSGTVFAEKAAVNGYRHIEVQILGDGTGDIRHLWDRECSIQRRFQKVVEFAPSSLKDRSTIKSIVESAVRMAKHIKYTGLGTWEFLVHEENREFYFLEINPRIQVEHTITEQLALGLDLVKLQIQIAQGYLLKDVFPSHLSQDPETPPPIHSLQLRVTAEDADNNWSLSVGKITDFRFPGGNGVRVDTHLIPGQEAIIGTEFDTLLAKIVISAPTWEDVVRKARRALGDTFVEGVKTNLGILRASIDSDAFVEQTCDTQWLEGNLSTLLAVAKASKPQHLLKNASKRSSAPISASSNVLFRKGDAWSISLTPSLPDQQQATHQQTEAKEQISHLQLTRIHRNEFPTSLTASILYTTPLSPKPQAYTLTLASTTSSFASLSNVTSHRRGEPGNERHIVFPFAGKLIEVLVEEGDEVQKGETVAVVRQMKMELEIRAARGGRVVWVYEGEEGDEVGEGVIVAELEGGEEAKL